MARQLKPQKVDSFIHGLMRRSYDVMLNRNEMTFFVQLTPTEKVEAESKNECVREAKKRIDELVEYDWKPFILIDGPPDPERRHFSYNHSEWIEGTLAVKFRRCEISPNPSDSKKRIERSFLADLHPTKQDPNSWGYKEWAAGQSARPLYSIDAIVIPFSDESWMTLVQIKKSLDNAKKSYEDFLRAVDKTPDKFLEMIRGQIPLMLQSKENDS